MYAVGIDEETGENVIVVTVPSIGWSDFYFRLTNEEASSWKHDSHALDDAPRTLADWFRRTTLDVPCLFRRDRPGIHVR